jgi:hypothetical protein
MTICYSFPSRSRPSKFFAALDNIKEMSASKDYFIVAKIDYDDETMNNLPVLTRLALNYPEVIVKLGHSKNKVDAINRSLDNIHAFDILMVHADDMHFTQHGFDDIVRKQFENFSGLVHFPDGHVNERLCTYAIMDKKYYDKFGYIYNPKYSNVYCDNEMHDVAVLLNQYKFVNEKILLHKNPMWGYGKPDELFLKTENPQGYKIDGEIYRQRKSNNFYL